MLAYGSGGAAPALSYPNENLAWRNASGMDARVGETTLPSHPSPTLRSDTISGDHLKLSQFTEAGDLATATASKDSGH